jgi:hypothetical protein
MVNTSSRAADFPQPGLLLFIAQFLPRMGISAVLVFLPVAVRTAVIFPFDLQLAILALAWHFGLDCLFSKHESSDSISLISSRGGSLLQPA